MNPISRTQAYAKLVILMADGGLPAPKSMGFDADGPIIEVDTGEAVALWAAAIGVHHDIEPYVVSTGVTTYTACGPWEGMQMAISAMIRPPAPEPTIAADLSRVREVAEPAPEREAAARAQEDAASLGVSVEAMDGALRWLAAGLNARPELLDDKAVSE